MAIVWSGRGFLSAVVLFITLIICVSIIPLESSDYVFIISAFVTGLFSWFFGKKWNANTERILVDEKTGKRLKAKKKHTFFYIPMEYWGFIFPAFGIIILFQNSIVGGVISTIILSVLTYLEFNKSRVAKDKIAEATSLNNKMPNAKFNIGRKEQLPFKDKVVEKKANKIKLGQTKPQWKKESEMTKAELEEYHRKYMPK